MLELFNGSKTYIGVMVWGLIQVLRLLMPEHEGMYAIVEPLALTLTGVGVGHKLTKLS